MSQTWDETKEKAGRARERTEYFVRENPVPTILGALGLGIAIGLAIRFALDQRAKGRNRGEVAARETSTGVFFRCLFSGRYSNQPEKNMKARPKQ